MRKRILWETRFREPRAGLVFPAEGTPGFSITRDGGLVSPAAGQSVRIDGPGVHARNGDSIELHFRLLDAGKGALHLGFSGGFEHSTATIDFGEKTVSLSTSEWRRPQPLGRTSFRMRRQSTHVLLIEKTEAGDGLVKNADLRVCLDGQTVLEAPDLDMLPEMGLSLGIEGTRVLLQRLVHRGIPSGIPEYLHVGGWQMLNRESIDDNLASVQRGLRRAAEEGIELLVTPETSLTGLFPASRVTREPKPVAAAERKVRRFMRGLRDCPYLVMGLPVWERKTRYNVSRVYDPDGEIVSTHAKIHSCESHFWHGYRLAELEVNGVPVCMHICHDGRYPEVWTLPVMFGARLIVHPCNGGSISGSIDGFERSMQGTTSTSHAFYLRVNGGGGSCLISPQKHGNLMAVSPECRRDVPTFPSVGPPQEGLLHAPIRVHDAYGYWPMRSFRASEQVASSYLALYRAMGGGRGT